MRQRLFLCTPGAGVCLRRELKKKQSYVQHLAHLRVAHKEERPTETQINDLAELHDIHICPSCSHMQPCSTLNALNKHTNTRQLIQQTKTKLELITDTHRNANKETWQQALTFLNHLNIEPPPFRSTTCRHAQALTKVELFATCRNLNKWMLLASAPLDPNHQHVDPTKNTSDPFWKPLFTFEALILFPPPKQQKLANCSRIAQARTRQFRKSNIIASCKEAFDLDKCTAPSMTPPSFDDATTLSNSAQVAADADNCGVASQRMQSCMPTVTVTDETSEEIKNTCPGRINFPSSTSEPTCPNTHNTQHTTHNTQHTTHNTQQEQQKANQTATTSSQIQHCPINRDSTIRALRNIKKGTAPGPFTHSSDFIRAHALTRNK
jgi:hypothetical protein